MNLFDRFARLRLFTRHRRPRSDGAARRRCFGLSVQLLEDRSLLSTILIANAGFEAPALGTGFGAYQYNPTGAGWTFSGTSSNGSGVAGNGSAFSGGNPNAPEGTQVAFLQNAVSSISQILSFGAGTYTVSFFAAQRAYEPAGPQNIQVVIDNNVVGAFTPSGTSYTAFATDSFAVIGGMHTLAFVGATNGDSTALIDQVNVSSIGPTGPVPSNTSSVPNAGFEVPSLGTGFNAYQYNPSGATWTFNGSTGDGSGIAANGSAFTNGDNPNAPPQGTQVAFLQNADSSISQSLSLAAGIYSVSFFAAQRTFEPAGPQSIQVLIDGKVIGTFTPSFTFYAFFSTSSFTVATGTHTLAFHGLTSGDSTALLDQVKLNPLGLQTSGIYDGSGDWFLNNSNANNPSPMTFQFGFPGTTPVSGDWLGDGLSRAGLYYAPTGQWFLDHNPTTGDATPIAFQFGYPGTSSVAGDWIGDGTPRVGIYDPSNGTWYLDHNAGGGDASPIAFQFGFPGTIPVVGDWLGDGVTRVGIYQPATGMWFLDHNFNNGDASPITFQFGFPGTLPIASDWIGDGTTRVGVYYPTTGQWFLDNNINNGDSNPSAFQFGFPGTAPVAGDWDFPMLPQLASGPGPGTSTLLTQQQLNAEVQGALVRLQLAGADPATLARLAAVHYVVGNLSSDTLGQAALYGNEVVIAASADGWGWFVDSTPLQDQEFLNSLAFSGSPTAGHMDLLTTVLHEMGHIVGLGDLNLPASSTNVMNEWLTPGARHMDGLNAFLAGR